MKFHNSNEFYMLVGYSEDNSVKVATELKKVEDKLIITMEKSPLNNNYLLISESGTITCSGCSYSCDPVKIQDRWICENQCGNNCTKTITRPIQ